MSLPSSISTKINWNKFIPDLILMLLYFFYLQPMMVWQQKHLALSCTLLMLLNIAAVGLGCFSFFTAFEDMELLTKYKNSLTTFESSTLGLAAFISCFAFLWWLVPFAAAKKMGVTETGFIIGALVYFITFMGVVAGTISNKAGVKLAESVLVKILTSAVTTIFFFFSYAFLSMAMQYWQPSFMAASYLAILCLLAFYLPLRFFLLLRPPLSKLEYVSFILSFGYLLLQLFVEL